MERPEEEGIECEEKPKRNLDRGPGEVAIANVVVEAAEFVVRQRARQFGSLIFVAESLNAGRAASINCLPGDLDAPGHDSDGALFLRGGVLVTNNRFACQGVGPQAQKKDGSDDPKEDDESGAGHW